MLEYLFSHIAPNSIPPPQRHGDGISLYTLLVMELNLTSVHEESDSKAAPDPAKVKANNLTDEESYQELVNMLSIPWYLEKFMIFGLIVCFNSFLTLFTLAPIKIIIVISKVIRGAFNRESKTERLCKLATVRKDVITLTLIFASLAVLYLGKFDISKMYHDVRGQADIKLYVMFGVLEVAEKLCSSIGQDLLNILHHTSSDTHRFRFTLFYLMSVIYLSFHAYILIYQAVSLNVAANSYSNALFTLLLSNQFAELKSSVFKKIDREGLFQITMADLSERFQLTVMLGIIAIRNLLQFQASNGFTSSSSWTTWNICIGVILKPFIIVIGSELFVDWLKHCFISKFNKIKPKVYRNFLYVSCLDFLQVFQFNAEGEKKKNHEFTDYIVLTRRIGLPLLASAVCFLRMTLGDFKHVVVLNTSSPIYNLLGTLSMMAAIILTLLLLRILLVLAIFKIATSAVTRHRRIQDELKSKISLHGQNQESPTVPPVPQPETPNLAQEEPKEVNVTSESLSSPIDLSFLPGSPNPETSSINPSTRAHLYDADEVVPPTPEEKRNNQLLNGPLNEHDWRDDDGDEGLSKVMRYKMSSKRIW
ncbi:uncharacterized protein LODBEIA_P42860 [Lodderomyces beijingensis]|uniref:Uncharacterized protein n=1 Tax=Lodderomyces beijingensis TaxID=1775926 RepID=A0ABP0ZPJ9_9ASCO